MTSQPIPRGDTWQVVFTWLLSSELISRCKLPTITNMNIFAGRHCADSSLRFREPHNRFKIPAVDEFSDRALFSRVFIFNNHRARLPTRSVFVNERKPENDFSQLSCNPIVNPSAESRDRRLRIYFPRNSIQNFSRPLTSFFNSSTFSVFRLRWRFAFLLKFKEVVEGRRLCFLCEKFLEEPLWWVGL